MSLETSDFLPLAARSFDEAAAAQMERFVADFGHMYRERNEALREVARAHHEALLRLSLAADCKDDDTGGHIVRIGFLAEALALLLGEPAGTAHMLRKAAPMHDIGKIGTPDSVLKKAGPLDAAEREVMNQHAAQGAAILGRSRIPLFQLAAAVAQNHHERYDGRGYPQGLRGEQIPLAARITAVVDFYDALTMDRVYRRACPPEKVLDMLRAESGKAFDPRIVTAFEDHFEELEALRCRINAQALSYEALLDSV